MCDKFKVLDDIKMDFSKSVLLSERDIKFVKVSNIYRQTETEYLLRFDCKIDHDPGQFMQVSVLGIGEAPMSFASYSKDYFELSVRNVGNVSSHICALKKGDVVGIRGPYGRGYNMKWFSGNNMIIIGGGSGIAPVRGVIEYIDKNRDEFLDVNLFFGFRTMHDMLFEPDYKRWKENKMSIDIVFSQESNHPNIKSGMITDILDCEALSSNKDKIVLICGPPVMIKAVCKFLVDKNGFNKNQIYISEERTMKCGVGRCGHCMIQDKYCCTDGPVFRYDELDGYVD